MYLDLNIIIHFATLKIMALNRFVEWHKRYNTYYEIRVYYIGCGNGKTVKVFTINIM